MDSVKKGRGDLLCGRMVISDAPLCCGFFRPLVWGGKSWDPTSHTAVPDMTQNQVTDRSAEGYAVLAEPSVDSRPIYMDHHATTPVDDEVVSAMLPYFAQNFGNPSSTTHVYGAVAREATERAREEVAELINAASADEIIFTGGATESDNLAIEGVAYGFSHRGKHIITSAIEHKAVLQPCKRLETEGFRVTYLPVDQYGLVEPDSVLRAIAHDTILISLQYVNSEIGTIQPLDMIGQLARERNVIFHTDAAQATGKIRTDVRQLKVDVLSLSGHKMYGPKGVGALYVRKGVDLEPILLGGGQEKGYRAGTLNVPGIVGLGKACEIARRDLESECKRLSALRDRLTEGLLKRVALARVNGHPTRRLPHNLNISFEYVDSEALIESLPEIALSAGSACTSQSKEPSYVLLALGLSERLALSAIRFGLGRCNTTEQVDRVVDLIASSIEQLRNLSPLFMPPRSGGVDASGLTAKIPL